MNGFARKVRKKYEMDANNIHYLNGLLITDLEFFYSRLCMLLPADTYGRANSYTKTKTLSTKILSYLHFHNFGRIQTPTSALFHIVFYLIIKVN